MVKLFAKVREQRARGESGSSLVIALAFLALFGLIVPILLSFGFAAVRQDRVVRASRDARYAADGAVEGAMKRYQAMLAAGTSNPCSVGDPNAWYTFTVRDRTATVQCAGQAGTGGTPNPPQVIPPTAADSTNSDFTPVNGGGTSATLFQTVQYPEGTAANGTVANTSYPYSSANQQIFTYTGATPPVGAQYAQVVALVSHREGTGPGNAPNQDQSITVITGDTAGNLNVNCGTFTVTDAKASGGPSWPVPPYQTIDVTYQSGHQGDTNFVCMNTPARIQNAQVTYLATSTACSGRTFTGATTSASKTITSASAKFRSTDVGQAIAGTGIAASSKIASVTNGTTAVMDKNATATSASVAMTLGSPCGSVSDLLDNVSLCVCLEARPSVSPSGASGGHDFHTHYGNCASDFNNYGTREVVWSNATNCATPPSSGTGVEPTCAGAAAGPCLVGSNTKPAHASFAQFQTPVGEAHSIAYSGFSWPATSAVTYVTLRVVHAEQFTNLKPSVRILGGGIDCTIDASSSPALDSSSSYVFADDRVLLPSNCAPDTQAKMSAITVTYTATCATAGSQGAGKCGSGGTTVPAAALDSLTFELDYQLGGAGGYPQATFSASVGGVNKVGASATFHTDDNTVAVTSWQVH